MLIGNSTAELMYRAKAVVLGHSELYALKQSISVIIAQCWGFGHYFRIRNNAVNLRRGPPVPARAERPDANR